MKNIELLLDKNHINKKYKYNKIKLLNSMLHYNIYNVEVGGDEIKNIIDIINYVNDNYPRNIPLYIEMNNISFRDKLVYIILECIIYSAYSIYERKVFIYISLKSTSIWTEGINYSPLIHLLQKDYKNFLKKFNFDIYKGHYRKIINCNSDPDTLSKTAQDIRNFLIFNGVYKNDVNDLTEVITEVAGNAIEHSTTDCLIDIDITDSSYIKKDSDNDDQFYGMNVAIVSFSDVLFYEPLKNRMKNRMTIANKSLNSSNNLTDRYNNVIIARNKHKNYFTQNLYSENDFYIISSYQNKISGNTKKGNTGGTGLTCLIKSLAESAEEDYCYMMTGNRVLYFINDYLKYDNEGWIGFNNSCNYFSEIPDIKCFGFGRTYVPGTIYNLGFVIRKDKDGK